jgi:hypothetical protein
MKIINKRKVGGMGTPVKVKEYPGKVTEGIYQGSTLIESTRYKGTMNNLYTIQAENGEQQSFFGDTALDIRLKSVNIGDWVSITYKGKATSQKTGNQYHNYDVETGEVVEDDDPQPKSKKTLKFQPL